MLQLYLGVGEAQLRYFTIEGTKVQTPEEAASQAIQQAQQAESQLKQAESQLKQEQARAERLAAQLRQLGIDPK